MSEQQQSVAPFYKGWEVYQGHLVKALAPLTAEQLALRAAPGLRSIGETALHIVGGRSYWFTNVAFRWVGCAPAGRLFARVRHFWRAGRRRCRKSRF